jgi:integrase/recombinase XerC
VSAHLAAFLEYLRLNRNASPHTVAAYESDLTQFLTFASAYHGHSNLEPAHLDLGTIRAFMADLYRLGHARSSVARKLSALRAFGRYLRREGWIDADPAMLAAAPRRERKVPAHLSIDEMTHLLDVPDASVPLGRRDRAILELFYASGLRLSELVGLDVEDVNLRARMVRVMGKGGKERLVPFNSTAEQSLRAWFRDRAALRDPGTSGRAPSARSREPLFLN